MRVIVNGMPVLRQRTGIGQYSSYLLRALAAVGRLEEIGVFDGRRVQSLPEFDRHCQVRPMRWPGWLQRCARHATYPLRRAVDAWHAARLQRQTASGRWTLYHETCYVAPRCGLPLVVTVHDLCHVRFPQFVPSARRRWLELRLAETLRRASAVLADSHFTRRELLHFYPWLDAQRVLVAHLGVDRQQFRPRAREEISQLRRRYCLPPRFILYTGTLEPRKNLQGLLEAYCMLRPGVQREYPLVLAGALGWHDGVFRSRLHKLRDQGMLRELGYVPQSQLGPLMAAATVFCFPSLYEGFGLPPLEAASCGTPVLCSHTASLPEVMGDAAWYVDPLSPGAIATSLERLLDDPALRATLRERGLALAGQYTWEACAQQTLKAYRAAA
ncbi:MAG: glycosyltransferase family 4 protein [Pirellulales bacterium]|nr:glycosyltransferase family 4 protein [Pirellulales bacterium]